MFFSFTWMSNWFSTIGKTFSFSPLNFNFVFVVNHLTTLMQLFIYFSSLCFLVAVVINFCTRILCINSPKCPICFCLGPLLPVLWGQSRLSDWCYSDSVHRIALSGMETQTIQWWGLNQTSCLQNFCLSPLSHSLSPGCSLLFKNFAIFFISFRISIIFFSISIDENMMTFYFSMALNVYINLGEHCYHSSKHTFYTFMDLPFKVINNKTL